VMIATYPPGWIWLKGLRNDHIGAGEVFVGARSKAEILFPQAPQVAPNGVTFDSNEA
jgi:hypothetical protein